MNDYLAKKYGMTSKTTKKTKKSAKSSASYAIIDEDEFVDKWKAVSSDDDNDSDLLVSVDNSEIANEEKIKRWRPIGDEDEAPQIVQNLSESLDNDPTETLGPKRKRRRSHSSDRKMTSGLSVGLQTADKMKKDMERIEKETKAKLKNMDPSRSGRDAETVYRDKYGKKIDIVAQKAEERRKIEEEEKYMKWGKEDQISKEEELRHKPLAIYKDDKELNEELKAQERWDDPAALFLTKVSDPKSKKKESSRPKYQGPPPPPNRFNIPPGYRWDGIDRSNGFEKAYFDKLNTRSALASEAYSWSVEDM
ncbi:28718_t:CDS:2 [Gigaspora margarita]|uniref:28718_t:CDS:1 n=1 Tax=Gigaspora margarita TaxID=4874 RepID=A0ABN7VS72_GIGMA|nr:28718_t:CDS:2 [Gigaspora margarita]